MPFRRLAAVRPRTRVAAAALALAVAVLLVPALAPPAGAMDSDPPAGSAAWMHDFSRLPDGSWKDAGPGASWRHDLRLALALEPKEDAVPAGPDWIGLTRDTALLVGYQLVSTGIIMLLPEDVSNWSDKTAGEMGERWVENVQSPSFDDDAWWINYVMHPYFGGVYYIRARERGFGEVPSFLYSAVASTIYEFGVEAFFEKPSIQDLIVTPVAGALVGAFVFEPIRRRIQAKPTLEWYDHVGLFLTDPLGALNTVVERLFGIKSEFRIAPALPILGRTPGRPDHARERMVGLNFSMRWR
jgi:hypothetical protein